MNKQVALKIEGVVQGVFYRVSAQKKAQTLGLVGWIKNMPDRSVQAVVEGDETRISEFIIWCKHASPGNTKRVQENWNDATNEFNKFDIKY